ncbi:MAG: excinuclease ABC subunit C [Candidatus Thorarchaeota archaeon]|nr:MAG: excinuclease ABC subunit C [Candidatus Thorarchaeota archaeon]
MPIDKNWSSFTMQNLKIIRNVFGVYELGNRNGVVIYIGSGKLHDRLTHWKSSSNPCIKQATNFRYEELYSDERCRQREESLLVDFKRRHGRLPECNDRIG